MDLRLLKDYLKTGYKKEEEYQSLDAKLVHDNPGAAPGAKTPRIGAECPPVLGAKMPDSGLRSGHMRKLRMVEEQVREMVRYGGRKKRLIEDNMSYEDLAVLKNFSDDEITLTLNRELLR